MHSWSGSATAAPDATPTRPPSRPSPPQCPVIARRGLKFQFLCPTLGKGPPRTPRSFYGLHAHLDLHGLATAPTALPHRVSVSVMELPPPTSVMELRPACPPPVLPWCVALTRSLHSLRRRPLALGSHTWPGQQDCTLEVGTPPSLQHATRVAPNTPAARPVGALLTDHFREIVPPSPGDWSHSRHFLTSSRLPLSLPFLQETSG